MLHTLSFHDMTLHLRNFCFYMFHFHLINFLHYCTMKNRAVAYCKRSSPRDNRRISKGVKHFQLLLTCPEILVVARQGCRKLNLLSLVLSSPVFHLRQGKRRRKVGHPQFWTKRRHSVLGYWLNMACQMHTKGFGRRFKLSLGPTAELLG